MCTDKKIHPFGSSVDGDPSMVANMVNPYSVVTPSPLPPPPPQGAPQQVWPQTALDEFAAKHFDNYLNAAASNSSGSDSAGVHDKKRKVTQRYGNR